MTSSSDLVNGYLYMLLA